MSVFPKRIQRVLRPNLTVRPGGVLRHVPVRVLLIALVLVPWGGMAYRTADRIDHDRGELAFTEELAPSAIRVKLLARVQRELEIEAAVAELKVSGTVSELIIEKDLTDSRRKIDKALGTLEIYAPAGVRKADLKRVRDSFDAATVGSDPAISSAIKPGVSADNGYTDLLAKNRAALNTAVRELWVLVAMLGGDEPMRDNLLALELSMHATDSSVRESNLLLHESAGAAPNQLVGNLIAEEQRSALSALQSISVLPVPLADAAKDAIGSADEVTIAKATLRLTGSALEKPRFSLEETKQLYQLLARRNARLGTISDSAAIELSLRSQLLIREQRNAIGNFIWWLLGSLVLTLTIAALVGRWIWRPIRDLGRQAVALVDGVGNVETITPRGPRELVTSARALNDLTETLMAVQKQADALATGPLDDAVHLLTPPSRLGSSVQLAVRRLSESIQLNNQLRDEFEYAANHDTLTGLPNRAAVYRRLEAHIRAKLPLALLFVDLDHFKGVNDTEGHLAGDEILRVMGTRFAHAAGPNRMVARLGGDEFLIVCSSESLAAAGDLADIIKAAASQPIDLGNTSMTLGASVGFATSQPADTVSSLLQRADQALYEAKANGRRERSRSATSQQTSQLT